MNLVHLPGLYIHIPFCISKCPYCTFYSLTDTSLVPTFLAGLTREMALYRETFPTFDTIYLGGGTPSVLTAGQIGKILSDVRKYFVIADGAEITIEANPADLCIEFLQTLQGLGINRLNIGCQSFDDAALAFLGRRHTGCQSREAIHNARKAGFANLGIDLIYGLPALLGEESAAFAVWTHTLSQAIAMLPEHLSCYQLTVEEGTPMAERIKHEGITLPNEEMEARYFFRTSDMLETAGYRHYEVSNFARDNGLTSRHNSKYWDHTPYLGLGPAAHSFDGARRWWNHRDVPAWLSDLNQGKRPVAGEESLSVAQLRLEALFLGLRTAAGIDLTEYLDLYGCDLRMEKGAVIDQLLTEGLLSLHAFRLAPTRNGLACADALARMLC